MNLFEESIIMFLNLIWNLGYLGLFIIMFFAGFCAPIPWELVLIPTGASSLDPFFASIIGGLGASLGAALGYCLGKRLGRPLTLKYGRYISIDGPGLEIAERWIVKWGLPSIIIFRSIQYLPYKTFNIAAGILNTEFFNYIVLTIIGSIIRCFSLVYLGKLVSINIDALAITTLALLFIGCLIFIFKYVKYHEGRRAN